MSGEINLGGVFNVLGQMSEMAVFLNQIANKPVEALIPIIAPMVVGATPLGRLAQMTDAIPGFADGGDVDEPSAPLPPPPPTPPARPARRNATAKREERLHENRARRNHELEIEGPWDSVDVTRKNGRVTGLHVNQLPETPERPERIRVHTKMPNMRRPPVQKIVVKPPPPPPRRRR